MALVAYDGVRRLPAFDLDLDGDRTPAEVRALREALSAADALLLACPEYGHGVPGALKNALDWVFGSGELAGKPVGITAAVLDPRRGWRGLRALARSLRAMDARVVGGAPIVVAADGEWSGACDGAVLTILDALATPSATMSTADEHPAQWWLAGLSLEGSTPMASDSRDDTIAAAVGAAVARAHDTLAHGELDAFVSRIEAALYAPEVLRAFVDQLDGSAALGEVLARLGARSEAALDDLLDG